MKKTITAAVVLGLGIAFAATAGFGRGFGGFHGGGGGFSGGGFRGGGFSGGGFSGGEFRGGSFGGGGFEGGGMRTDSFGGGSFGGGGMRTDSFGGESFGGGGMRTDSFGGGSFGGGAMRTDSFGGARTEGFSAGGFRAGGAEGGEFRAGDYDSVNRGQLNGFLGLPTDGGFHAAAGAEGHVYQGPAGTTVAHGSAGVRGAAVGPEGAAAGGRSVSGTAVKGPEGNVYTHETTAGRGIAAGPNGVEAGRYAGSRTGVNGTTVAGRGIAGYGYGTHPWSPTYYHGQAVAGRSWCYGNHFYTAGWCGAHPWAWCPLGYAAADWAAACWAPATWTGVGAWLGYDDAEPYAYNYGNQIVYNDGNVYYGDEPAGTQDQYYQEAVTLASSTTAANTGGDTQWLPLGVFGLMAGDKKTPDMLFQLAVDKSGAIRGNYYDETTQKNLPVTGAVDKKSQRVSWTVSGGNGMVVETGLYNLTQDESTALVHLSADRTEQDLLVRMKDPSAEQTQASSDN